MRMLCSYEYLLVMERIAVKEIGQNNAHAIVLPLPTPIIIESSTKSSTAFRAAAPVSLILIIWEFVKMFALNFVYVTHVKSAATVLRFPISKEIFASVDDAETLIDIDGNWLVILCCKNADAGADGRMKLLFDTALASIPAGQLLIKISSTVHLDEFGHSEK